MVSIQRVVLAWSGGKDSTLALASLRAEPQVTVVGLLTTMTQEHDRIVMHGVRRELLRQQATSLGLPLREVILSQRSTNAEYEARMEQALQELRSQQGVDAIAFGDLFLEDIRAYRERLLERTGFRGLFPLWGHPTAELARDFIAKGYRAILICVDPKLVPSDFAGRLFDEALLRDLPPGADPCGENGEFHTFVFDGPLFAHAIAFRKGEVAERQGFVYCDLIPQ